MNAMMAMSANTFGMWAPGDSNFVVQICSKYMGEKNELATHHQLNGNSNHNLHSRKYVNNMDHF